MKSINILLFIATFFICGFVYPSDSFVQVTLHNKNYDNMSLKILTDKYVALRIPGNKDNNSWRFTVPDSIYEKCLEMSLLIKDVHPRSISFKMDKKTAVVTLPLNKNVELAYLSTDTAFLDNRQIFSILDVFEVKKPDKTLLASKDFVFCIGRGVNKNTYGELKSLLQKYNDVSPGVAALYKIYASFDKNKELAPLYNLLSPELKQSYLGRKIGQYINTTLFPVMLLPESSNNLISKIIQNPAGYTLVVFSASWCAPCRKEIPLLKEIYKDLSGKNFDLVSVSIDDSTTVNDWYELTREYQMEWKSYIAADCVEKVKETYSIQGIPCSYIVYPNGEFDKIDVRKESDKSRLYKLVNQ